ncbi:Bug family tripartite tricarboxylate transporter substrate binding protein [Comamonas sp. UBA7528]|uniref:Bug family tripartite tricarboxylate transporter substrate binding protein n=1 Tax=Comamonas sp. UBA7528 TaxID=1946391 RepID=UPI0025BB0D75|nr:tripartite tricarboxylate transporter substrate binding protein [Comamonas sp. UBA7528]
MQSTNLSLLLISATAFALPAMAQSGDYPSKPITIVVPFSAGGGVDAMARLVAEKLRVSLKQSVLVDNKPGASGMVGAALVSKAAGDGYTLLLGSAGETSINPLVYKARMQYQPERDLVPIALVSRVPNVLVATPSFHANSIAELAAYAAKNPGKVTYATSGVGNPQHLNGELLQSILNVKMQHVPYKGATGQLVDVASGAVNLTFVSYAGAAPFLKGGRVKALAVTSAKRTSFAPDIPAIAETPAAKAYDLENWFGVFAPAKTPAAIQNKLNEAIAVALKDHDLVKRLREQGGEPEPMTQAQFREFIGRETAKYARIVEAANITPE